jgi:hypothetical protein
VTRDCGLDGMHRSKPNLGSFRQLVLVCLNKVKDEVVHVCLSNWLCRRPPAFVVRKTLLLYFALVESDAGMLTYRPEL